MFMVLNGLDKFLKYVLSIGFFFFLFLWCFFVFRLYSSFGWASTFNASSNYFLLGFPIALIYGVFSMLIRNRRVENLKKSDLAPIFTLGRQYFYCWLFIFISWFICFLICLNQETTTPFLLLSSPFLGIYLFRLNFNLLEDLRIFADRVIGK